MNAQSIISRSERFFRYLKILPSISISTIVLAAACGVTFALDSANLQTSIFLWLFGVAILIPYCDTNFIFKKRGNKLSKSLGFCVLAASCAASISGHTNIGLALVFLSPVTYFGNKGLFLLAVVPISIWTLAIPNAEYLNYFASYPLRAICANFSALLLNIGGVNAEVAGALISIDGRQIAITSACSGLEELEALVLICWIIAVALKKNTVVRIIYMSALLPSLILANSLRITLTIAGLEHYGNIFLSDGVHIAFGLGTIVLSIAIFLLIGTFLPSEALPKSFLGISASHASANATDNPKNGKGGN